MDEIWRSLRIGRNQRYQDAVDKVRELITELAPEVVQDLENPVKRTLTVIEANKTIEQQEKQGAKRLFKDWLGNQQVPPTTKE
jgi:hypothetical protein